MKLQPSKFFIIIIAIIASVFPESYIVVAQRNGSDAYQGLQGPQAEANNLTDINISQHIQLGQYYAAELPGLPDDNVRNMLPFFVLEYLDETLTPEEVKKAWLYYTIDAKDQLEKELLVTDQEHAINQLKTDLKFANVDQYQDLIIEVIDDAEDQFSDADLYINLGSQAPTLRNSDLRCTFYGEDICVISGKELIRANSSEITIGVFCQRYCKVKLRAQLAPEINLASGKMHNIYFQKDQQRIMRFEIPQNSDIDQIQIKGISENKFAEFEMLVMQGNQVPDTSEALILYPAWENGFVGKFEKNCECFCTGCNYTVLVSSKSEGYISLGAQVSGEIIDLKTFLGGVAFDSVHYNDAQCYQYQVTDPDKDLIVKIQAYSGQPEVHVNPSVIIDRLNFTKALFNSKKHFWNQELVLDSQQRSSHGCQTGTYYICVYGESASTYKITAINEDHSIMLKAGLSEIGYVNEKQVKQYYYTDSSLRDEQARVAFDTVATTGSIRIKSKLCAKPSDMKLLQSSCNFTEEEMNKPGPNDQIMQKIGSATEKPDPLICSPNLNFENHSNMLRSSNEAPCIYVIGVIGLSKYTSQYSLTVQLLIENGSQHPFVLSEGVPHVAALDVQSASYYQISIEDPQIQELTIQLTTIHGDPDIYVSSKTQTPSKKDHEYKSTRMGLYPDFIKIKSSETYNLSKIFYIQVVSDESSSFSLIYFTENGNGTTGTQKLIVGKVQKGVLHINQNPVHKEDPIIDQPSFTYHFSVSNKMLLDDNQIEIKLNSEHGEFMYLVQVGKIPEYKAKDFNIDKKDAWLGGELQNVIIRKKDVDSQLLEEDKSQYSDKMIDIYLRVYPFVRAENFTNNSEFKEAYIFNIAYYDQEQTAHLKDGQPQRGVVSSQQQNYYFFDIQDVESDYEVSLGPISGGNPDFVLSFDTNNKYPTPENNQYSSKNEFTTYNVLLKKETIQELSKKGNHVAGNLQAYVGVYTSEDLSVYSIMATKKVKFNPIQLKIGQVLLQTLSDNEIDYFMVQTSSSSRSPIKIDLIPINGNPDLSVTVIGDLSASKAQMEQLSKKPDYRSTNQYGVDSIVVDPELSLDFKQKCASNCVLLISVTSSKSEKELSQFGQMTQTHYRIQVSQDFEELLENILVTGQIRQKYEVDGEKKIQDYSRYKFYKYYKSCDQECDLLIEVQPRSSYGSVISVLVNFEDTSDIAQNNSKVLPTWQNNPVWTISLKVGSVITIEGTEPYFFEHKKNQESQIKTTSRGYFIIGIHSYDDVGFTIQVSTALRSAEDQSDVPLDIRQLYIGAQDSDILVRAGQTQYFYFQNWREEELKFSIQFLNQHFTSSKKIDLQVGLYQNIEDQEQGRRPKYISQLPQYWMNSMGTQEIIVPVQSKGFCVFCTYIIKLVNNYQKDYVDGDQKLRVLIQQRISKFDEIEGNEDNLLIEQAYTGQIFVGTPQPVRLDQNQILILSFEKPQAPNNYNIALEILLGQAKVYLIRNRDRSIIFDYPNTLNQADLIDQNLIEYEIKSQEHNSTLNTWLLSEQYSLKIISQSEVFQGIVYLSDQNSLKVISDGFPHEFDYTFVASESRLNRKKSSYFLYLPMTHNFDLEINSKLKSFSSDAGLLPEIKGSSSNNLNGISNYHFDDNFFTFKISLKIIKLKDNLMGRDVKWNEEYVNDEQFDHILRTSNSTSGLQIYENIKFEIDPEEDLILVKIDGQFHADSSFVDNIEQAELQMSFRMSASDVSYLAPNQTVRSVVSDDSNKFKIFEFYINKLQFPVANQNSAISQGGMDIFIMLTPCSGNLNFFVSDNLDSLFSPQSELSDFEYQTLSIAAEKNKNFGLGVAFYEPFVRQKKSSISQGLNYTQSSSESQQFIGEYFDDFRIQGKRLTHIETLDGRKLYFGIQSIKEDERQKKAQKMTMIEENQSKRFKPHYDEYSRSKNYISTFEIKATYVPSDLPDLLDMYILQDYNKGIQITNQGLGRQQDRIIQISWSPVLWFDFYKEGIHYVEVKEGIQYKVYLGYNESSIDHFASLCHLEEIDQTYYSKNGSGGRCLVEDITQVKVMTVYDNSFVQIKGTDRLKGLKSAVVVAFILKQGEEPVRFAYAPVIFNEEFDFDGKEQRDRIIYIVGGATVMLSILAIFLITCLRKPTRKCEIDDESQGGRGGITLQDLSTSNHSTA